MTEQNQTQTQFKPIQVEIPYSETPFMTAFSIEEAIRRIAEAAGYMFAARLIRQLPSRHAHLIMFRIDGKFKGLSVYVWEDKIIVDSSDFKLEIYVNNLNDVYLTLWDIAERLGYEEITTINDDPTSEGVVLLGYGKNVEIWRIDEEVDGVYVPKKVLVKIGVSE